MSIISSQDVFLSSTLFYVFLKNIAPCSQVNTGDLINDENLRAQVERFNKVMIDSILIR